MLHSGPADAMDHFNYIRPQNQLVLLLQKGQSFPSYPHELSGSVSHLVYLCACPDLMNLAQLDEKTWYARMEALEKALKRYWSWVEKALFAFAFVASVTVVSDYWTAAEEAYLFDQSGGALTFALYCAAVADH